MRELSRLEATIYNEGERLIPGVTHDHDEEVRHRGSYAFWCAIIELDLDVVGAPRDELRTVDLGCGVGHGCVALSELPGASVVGVDVSKRVPRLRSRPLRAGGNIEYVCADLREFVPQMPDFDYVVSRGSIEHVPDGLDPMREARLQQRLMFDVPFAEPAGRNPHHVIHNATEETFSMFANAEIFFQDMAGVTYDMSRKPPHPNMIMCVSSRRALPRVTESSRFPVEAWEAARDRRTRPRWLAWFLRVV